MNNRIYKAFIPIFVLILFFEMTGITEANYEGTIGTSFTITGAGFGAKKPKVFIEYESRPGALKKIYAQVVNWSDASITCVWTKKLFPGPYNLWIKPNNKKIPPISGGLFTIKSPTIERIIPTTLRSGSSVTISGYYFTNKKITVYIEDLITKKIMSCKVLRSGMNTEGKSSLSFIVPEGTYENCKIILKTLIGETSFTITPVIIPPLKLTLAPLPTGTINMPYNNNVAMTASGGVPPYRYDCSISWAPGLHVYPQSLVSADSGECQIRGAPTTEGEYVLKFIVFDSDNYKTASQSIEIPFVVNPDTDIEKGFPVQTYKMKGHYMSGQGIFVLVGNAGDQQKQRILFPGLPYGPLYAWNSDGSAVAGWPISDIYAQGHPAIGDLSSSSIGNEVFVYYNYLYGHNPTMIAFSDSGEMLPGWPRRPGGSTVPTLADLDSDGLDEIIIFSTDGLIVYKGDGSILPGWPILPPYGFHHAISDLDSDGKLDIVSAIAGGNGTTLSAYQSDGTSVQGFPISLPDYNGYADTYPVIGDVDGDGFPEIIVAYRFKGSFEIDKPAGILIISHDGVLKNVMSAPDSFPYSSAPALADLDGDCIPEIIFQTATSLNVWKGDGTAYPGWPVTLHGHWLGNSAPIIGDVDGDQLPDIVITTYYYGVWVFNRNGQLHPRFPKMPLIGQGAVPAIADIDMDGHNEIIIGGDLWSGHAGMYDTVWVYDLGGPMHGRIEWGQIGGSAKHQHTYVCPENR